MPSTVEQTPLTQPRSKKGKHGSDKLSCATDAITESGLIRQPATGAKCAHNMLARRVCEPVKNFGYD